MSQSTDTISGLVTEGAAIKARAKADKKRLEEIEAQLIELGAGDYTGEGDTACKVIQPSPGIKVADGDIEPAREICGDEAFKKLFDRLVSYKPVKAFREVAEALLTAGKVKKLVALVEKPASPYVKWS